MSKSRYFRVAILIAAALASSGCGMLKKGKAKTPVLGERIPVLTSENDAEVDPATQSLPFTLPAPAENADWAESGGSASNSMGHLALGTALAAGVHRPGGAREQPHRAARRFAGRRQRSCLHDRHARRRPRVRCAQSARSLWSSQTPDVKGNEAALYGGGVAYDNGRIYATNGLGFVSAMSEQNGGIVWQVRPGGPLRGAPTVANGAVYVISQDNQIYSLKEDDGSTNWSQPASLEIAGIFGAAAPAVGQGTVVAGFSSGELNALPLRERPPGLAGPARADQHPHQRLARSPTSTPIR